MRDFHMVSPIFWNETKQFPDSAKLALAYLRTCRHQTSTGACYLPSHYGATDMEWTVRKFEKMVSWLAAKGAIVHDGDYDEIFVTNWFSVNAPRNANHYKGIVREVGALQSGRVKEALLAALAAEMKKRGLPSWLQEAELHQFPAPEEALDLARNDQF